MKQTILFLTLLLTFLSACTNDSGKQVEEVAADGKIASIIRSPVTAEGLKDTINVARMVFEETTYDFGEVSEGEVVTKSFRFKNTGKVPLIINGARSTCGCTVPTWPKEAIPPGGTGEIDVQFNTAGKQNEQKKPVTITANTYPSETVVHVNGFVKAKPGSTPTQ
ncbi:MAG: DUF1573 domain-containing protein [Saprospiraceae bacterium]|nr:DUF1573 domain-containing protein [Saprospiraceae bacterium]